MTPLREIVVIVRDSESPRRYEFVKWAYGGNKSTSTHCMSPIQIATRHRGKYNKYSDRVTRTQWEKKREWRCSLRQRSCLLYTRCSPIIHSPIIGHRRIPVFEFVMEYKVATSLNPGQRWSRPSSRPGCNSLALSLPHHQLTSNLRIYLIHFQVFLLHELSCNVKKWVVGLVDSRVVADRRQNNDFHASLAAEHGVKTQKPRFFKKIIRAFKSCFGQGFDSSDAVSPSHIQLVRLLTWTMFTAF